MTPILAFDIETIPDIAGLRVLHGLSDALSDQDIVDMAHQKGRDTKEKILRNFGMPRPEGYRKALRLMRLAERFELPVFTFIDTPGAYPGVGAEERGQSEAIGRNLFEMAKLNVPIVCTVIGEGGSGGALAISVGDVLLMLDMNAAFSLEDCIRFAHAVEPFDIFWLEEPLHWHMSPTDFAVLARSTHIPIGHGERELTRHTVRDFIEHGGIRYVQFDATRAGGMTEAVRIAHLAEQHGVSIAPHLAPEIHSHLVAAFRTASFGVETMGGSDRNPLSYGLYRTRMQMRDGMVDIPQGPGWGAEVDWDFVGRHRA